MVGAGFSRNAAQIHEGAPQFPLWSDLARYLSTRLRPNSNRVEYDFLKLGQLYEAAFGREALCNVIRDFIPDLVHSPGEIHLKLLNLPWKDVFSVNYDTLLERSSENPDVKRAYQIIRQEIDLLGSISPRIVKLHGTLPSYEPFILTEEDYRCYPDTHPGMVNTVRQSMVESSLLLLGFSGNDPNFKSWLGWIRDRYNKRAPILYLCGVFDEDSVERSYYEALGVKIINMSFLTSRDNNPHGKASELLLDFLSTGNSGPILTWPYQEQRRTSLTRMAQDISIPTKLEKEPVLAWSFVGTGAEKKFEPNLQVQVESVVRSWKHNRKLYPGWLIMPEEERLSLAQATTQWYHALGEYIQDLDNNVGLEALSELCWRLKLYGEAVIGTYSYTWSKWLRGIPYNELSEIHRVYYQSIAFSLLTRAREDGDDIEWQFWSSWLESTLTLQEDRNRLEHERVLVALGRQDFEEITQCLRRWKAIPGAHFLNTRKAGHLAEIGNREEATLLAKASLDSYRRARRLMPESIQLESEQAWTAFLLDEIERSNPLQADPLSTPYSYWASLEANKHNPRTILNERGNTLLNTQNKSYLTHTVTTRIDELNGYQIESKSTSFGSNNSLNSTFSYMRIFDEVYPLCVLGVPWDEPELTVACEVLAAASPAWARSTVIRSSSSTVTVQFYDSPRLGMLATEDADRLTQISAQHLIRFYSDLLSLYGDYIQHIPLERSCKQALSQLKVLSCRQSSTGIECALSALSACLKSQTSKVTNRYFIDNDVISVFKEYIRLLDLPQLSPILDLLLAYQVEFDSYQLNKGLHPPQNYYSCWATLANRLLHENYKSKGINSLLHFDAYLSHIIFCLENNIHRESNALIIYVFHLLGWIKEEHMHRVGNVIWNARAAGSLLPMEIGLEVHALLELPSPSYIDPYEAVRDWLKDLKIDRVRVASIDEHGDIAYGVSSKRLYSSKLNALIYLSARTYSHHHFFTLGFIESLTSQLFDWWNDEKSYLQKRSFISDNFEAAFALLCKTLAYVVIRNDNRKKTLSKIESLQIEMKAFGIDTRLLELALCTYRRGNTAALNLARKFLVENSSGNLDMCLELIYWITDFDYSSRNKLVSEIILDLLVFAISSKDLTPTTNSLTGLTRLLDRWPHLFMNSDRASILIDHILTLVQEMSYPNDQERLFYKTNKDQLRMRRLTFRHLADFVRFLSETNIGNSAKIDQILEMLKASPFPEIRRRVTKAY